jgi:hypothetical protein
VACVVALCAFEPSARAERTAKPRGKVSRSTMAGAANAASSGKRNRLQSIVPALFRRTSSGVSAKTQREAKSWFEGQMRTNRDGLVREYRRRFGNVINADDARELSPHYAKSDKHRSVLASVIHEPASALAKEVYGRMLREPTPRGKANRVVLLAGGSGAGKTTAAKNVSKVRHLVESSHIVYDMTLASMPSSVDKIEQAIDVGKDVHIAFVYRDPLAATVSGVLPRARDTGRTVPIGVVSGSHAGAVASMLKLMHGYRADPRVSFTIVDLRKGADKAVITDARLLEGSRFHDKKLKSVLEDAVRHTVASGDLPASIGQQILGRPVGKGSNKRPDLGEARLPHRRMGESPY